MPHPLSIQNQTVSAQLTIDWDDGIRQSLPHLLLRGGCQCADCKTLRRHSKVELSVAADIRLTGIRPVGQYGMQLIFSDGHDRGIYPWPYLRELLSDAEASASVQAIR